MEAYIILQGKMFGHYGLNILFYVHVGAESGDRVGGGCNLSLGEHLCKIQKSSYLIGNWSYIWLSLSLSTSWMNKTLKPDILTKYNSEYE